MIIALRTDRPEAELVLYEDSSIVARTTWQAHRQLAETLHSKIAELLARHGYTNKDISGVVVYKGPGSFTGLRIGISVANTLAYAHSAPIVGSDGGDWLDQGVARLANGEDDHIVIPEYGAPVHITAQKK